jgi:hypothetical protein
MISLNILVPLLLSVVNLFTPNLISSSFWPFQNLISSSFWPFQGKLLIKEYAASKLMHTTMNYLMKTILVVLPILSMYWF